MPVRRYILWIHRERYFNRARKSLLAGAVGGSGMAYERLMDDLKIALPPLSCLASANAFKHHHALGRPYAEHPV